MKRLLFIVTILLYAPLMTKADPGRFSVSTNILDYARLGTVNVDASYGLSRHWSILAGARYNPFTFNEGDPERQFQYRQR